MSFFGIFKTNMEVTKKVYSYLDGGTIVIHTNKGKFCIDQRPNSATKNQLYNGDPDESKIVSSKKTINKLIDALKNNLNGEDFQLTLTALGILRKDI